MKERIRHILREEQSREERLRSRIISIIRGAGLSQAISSVGGVNNLIRILGVENSMKFLNLFNDMDEIIFVDEYDDEYTLLRFREGLNYFALTEEMNDGGTLFMSNDILKVINTMENGDHFYILLWIKIWIKNQYGIVPKNIFTTDGGDLETMG
jgi:hypothetical protein